MQAQKAVMTFCAMLFFVLPVSAQITIDQSDMPSPGDTVRKSAAVNFDMYDFTETGEDFDWDYSELLPVIQTIDTFVTVTETPLIYWPFFLLSSNMASPQMESPFPQIQLEEVFRFYHNSADKFKDVGFASTIFSIPLPFNFDSDDVIYDFPVDYANIDSSQSGFQRSVPGIGYLMVNRNRVNTVDGWGVLRTPYGTFDVLRIKSEVSEYDSIYLDSLNFGIPLNLNYTEYKWMGKGQKIPLLKATSNMFGLVVEYIDSVRDLTVDIPDNLKMPENRLTLFPNPVQDKLNISFVSAPGSVVVVKILGIDGRTYATFHEKTTSLGLADYTYNLSDFNLKPGKYIVNVATANDNMSEIFIYSR